MQQGLLHAALLYLALPQSSTEAVRGSHGGEGFSVCTQPGFEIPPGNPASRDRCGILGLCFRHGCRSVPRVRSGSSTAPRPEYASLNCVLSTRFISDAASSVEVECLLRVTPSAVP